jgi:hypothetical protein
VQQLGSMSSRAHLGLRLSALLLVLAAAVWPQHRDRGARSVATSAHLAVTTAARLLVDEAPRGRMLHATLPTEDAQGADQDHVN